VHLACFDNSTKAHFILTKVNWSHLGKIDHLKSTILIFVVVVVVVSRSCSLISSSCINGSVGRKVRPMHFCNCVTLIRGIKHAPLEDVSGLQ